MHSAMNDDTTPDLSLELVDGAHLRPVPRLAVLHHARVRDDQLKHARVRTDQLKHARVRDDQLKHAHVRTR